jgi:hypothetical protein
MRRIFDRGADTGYFYGADVPANAKRRIVQRRRGSGRAARNLSGGSAQTPVDGRLELVVGQSAAALTLTLDGREAAYGGDIVQAAKKAPDTQRYIAQIARLGDTPFELRDCALAMSVPA